MKKTPLFASLPAKVAAGVAGVALLTGGAGTVLQLQPAGAERTSTEDSVTTTEDDGTTTTTSTTTSTTSTTEAPTTTTTSTTVVEDDTETETEARDTFGAMVSEDARDGGVDGQEISAKAKARNEARRAERATVPTDDEDDDADDESTSPADAHRKNDRPAKG